jgi:hypothetical protein
MKYELEIQGHDEFGMPGIVVLNSDRPYFQPATSALQLAHDLIEHTFTPDPNGIADELQALGGVYWVRYLTGYRSPFATYSRPIEYRDLESDVLSLIGPLLWGEFDFPRCQPRTSHDSEFLHMVEESINGGVKSCRTEWPDERKKLRELEQDIRTHFKRWMCLGYQKVKERFPSNNQAVDLFQQIEKQSHQWLENSELGYRAKLTIIASKGVVELEEDWGDDYY